jgi:hypothetical protein
MSSVAPRSLVVYPVVLGGGTALFKDVTDRHALRFLEAKPLQSGLVRLTYSTRNLPSPCRQPSRPAAVPPPRSATATPVAADVLELTG